MVKFSKENEYFMTSLPIEKISIPHTAVRTINTIAHDYINELNLDAVPQTTNILC